MATDVVTTANKNFHVIANFTDTEVAKIRLAHAGAWVILGQAVIANKDGDSQNVSAKLMNQQNVTIAVVECYALPDDHSCYYLQATLDAKEREPITLECATYQGQVLQASILAFSVDSIDVQ
jgi:hypothetical protein